MTKSKVQLPAEALSLARNLRHNTTEAEQRLWYLLRSRRLSGFKFRRQHTFPPYILDFYCDTQRLSIELDGGQHVDDAKRDACREKFLHQHGIRVLRFWNDAIFKEGLINSIRELISRRESGTCPDSLPLHQALTCLMREPAIHGGQKR